MKKLNPVCLVFGLFLMVSLVPLVFVSCNPDAAHSATLPPPPPPPDTAMQRAIDQDKCLLLTDKFGNQYSAHHYTGDSWTLYQILQPTNRIVIEDEK